MGRTQMETQFPYPPPPPQLQSQPPNYFPPPQESYNHPSNVVYSNYDPKRQGIVNNVSVGAAPQYHHQSSPVMMPHEFKSTFPANSATTPIQQVSGVPWTTGLFDCNQDPHNALVTAVFPCVTFGQIADVLDNGHTTCATSGIMYAAAPCLMSRPYRRKLRQRFGLIEAPAPDWMVHSLFQQCALCQEYRELRNRGIDPALGYQGNLAKLENNNMMVPPNAQTMK